MQECQNVCQFDAIKDGIVNVFKCEGCGACTLVCPQKAITLRDVKPQMFISLEQTKGLFPEPKWR